ncbi:Mfa1 family fimbria major subunit [Bacteroides sp.]|uniref:Mfa1 family fimbria major subunit n=1 Tax=Bacteroides sp. TaxID=29523 RepID=UPI00258B8670|nr:Mfa1 family fimbria major subunit [Bacteroides sp.]
MKVHNLLLAGLLLLFAASCSSDDVNGDNSGTETDGVKAYLSLHLTSQSPLTRTDGTTTPPETEIDGDQQISSVAVLLADADGGIVQVSTNPNISGTQTVPFTVKSGTYFVYVVANPTAEVETLLNSSIGKNIQQVVALTAGSKADKYATLNKYTMMNYNKGITTKGGVSVTITSANSTPETAAQVTVPVDRFVARIRLMKEESKLVITDLKKVVFADNNEPVLDNVELVGQYLLNGAAKANLIQEWMNSTGSVVLNDPDKNNAIPTTDFYNRLEDIAIFDVAPNEENIIGTNLDVTTDFTILTYALENRPEILEVNDNATLVGYTSKTGETTGTIFQVKMTKGGADVPTFYKYKNYYFSTAAKAIEAYNADPANATDIPADTTDPGTLRKAGIRVYEDGMMYYTYWIQDNNYKIGTPTADKLYHVVHRNSVYNLFVDKLNNMGGDLPGTDVDPDPETPIEKPTYLQVTVDVKPWVISDNHIEL